MGWLTYVGEDRHYWAFRVGGAVLALLFAALGVYDAFCVTGSTSGLVVTVFGLFWAWSWGTLKKKVK